MYAIIGVSGKVGNVIASRLQKLGLLFKAVVRNKERAEELEQRGIKTVVAELDNAEALKNAFSGAQGIFVMTPPLLQVSDPVKDHNVMLDALVQAINLAKPGKVVYLSSVGAQYQYDTGAIKKLYAMEQAFQTLPVPAAAIRAAWFMENFTGNSGRNDGRNEQRFQHRSYCF